MIASAGAPTPAVEPAVEPPQIDLAAPLRAHRADDAAVRKSLQNSITVQFLETPLKEVLEFIRDQARIPRVWLDETSLQEEGIATDEPISRHLGNCTARQVLDEVCRPHGLAWFVDDGMLKLTTEVKANETIVPRMYDVGPLRDRVLAALKARRGNPDDGALSPPTPADAARDVQEFLSDDDSKGITGELNEALALDRLIVASRTHSGHERLAALLKLLDDFSKGVLKHGHRQVLPEGYPFAPEARSYAILAANTTFEFVNTPLRDVLEFLDDQHHITIVIDETALQEEGIATDEPLSFRADQLSLAAALRTMFAPLGLVATVDNGLLRITTRVKDDLSPRSVLYDVRDLTAAGLDEERLTELIGLQVAGPDFRGTGGKVRMAPMGGALLVTHNSRAQSAVALLLEDLRKSLSPDGLKPEAIDPQKFAADRDRLVTRFYAIDRKDKVESLAAALVDFVAPDTWKANGGPGVVRSVGTTLAVRQTVSVHRAIEKFLRELRTVEEAPPKPAGSASLTLPSAGISSVPRRIAGVTPASPTGEPFCSDLPSEPARADLRLTNGIRIYVPSMPRHLEQVGRTQ